VALTTLKNLASVVYSPSRGTLLYCFIALAASARLSKITSAVPIDLPDLS